MKIINGIDFLEIRLASLIADYDMEILSNLYQPLIGYQSTALYMAIWIEGKNQKITSLIDHNTFLTRMKMSMGEFIKAKQALEAIGLLRTYYVKNEGVDIYHYDLLAPKTPNGFFNDVLLYGLFIQNLGKEQAEKVKRFYIFENKFNYGKEISASFKEVFQPNFEDEAFVIASNNKDIVKDRNHGRVNSEFNYENFFSYLASISQINSEAITKKEMKELERLATLYGVSEETAADVVANCFDPTALKGKRLDIELINQAFRNENHFEFISNKKRNTYANRISGNSALADKINLFETTAPRNLLAALQNGTNPASADLKILEDLAINFKLTNAVINVLVDYTLTVNHNILSRAYIEKLAASLARSNIETAVDAMNYLKATNKNKKTSKIKAKETLNNQEELAPNIEKNSATKDNSDVSWDDLLADLDNKEGE